MQPTGRIDGFSTGGEFTKEGQTPSESSPMSLITLEKSNGFDELGKFALCTLWHEHMSLPFVKGW